MINRYLEDDLRASLLNSNTNRRSLPEKIAIGRSKRIAN
jgi:hypothetical protein